MDARREPTAHLPTTCGFALTKAEAIVSVPSPATEKREDGLTMVVPPPPPPPTKQPGSASYVPPMNGCEIHCSRGSSLALNPVGFSRSSNLGARSGQVAEAKEARERQAAGRGRQLVYCRIKLITKCAKVRCRARSQQQVRLAVTSG